MGTIFQKKNVTQMGLILVLVTTIGTMTREYQNNTFINLVTKGVSRSSIVLAKFVSSTVIFTLSYFLCFLICTGYTKYYFGSGLSKELFVSVLFLYSFFLLFLAVVIFSSTCFKKGYGGILIVVCFMGLLFLFKKTCNMHIFFIQCISKLKDVFIGKKKEMVLCVS